MAAFVWVPVCAQTVHVDSERIVYRDKIKVADASQAELFTRAQRSIANYVKQPTDVMANSLTSRISAQGKMKLQSPYHSVKTVEYRIWLMVNDGHYEYRIDSVNLNQKERGGKTNIISSRELLKGMDISGPESAKMEKELNEIDMNFQKLIDLLNREMKKT